MSVSVQEVVHGVRSRPREKHARNQVYFVCYRSLIRFRLGGNVCPSPGGESFGLERAPAARTGAAATSFGREPVMILHFSADELQLMVDFFEEQLRGLDDEIAHTERRNARITLEQEEKMVQEVEDKIMRRDLAFTADELEFLLDFLGSRTQKLRSEIYHTDGREYKQVLLNRLETLERMHDKVTEACCMTV